MGPIAQLNKTMDQKQDKVKWVDVHSFGQKELASEGDPEQDLCIKTKIEKINNHRKISNKSLKSVIKVPNCELSIFREYPSSY